MALTVPVTDSLLDSLVAVVDGTKTAEQAFADFLRSMHVADGCSQANDCAVHRDRHCPHVYIRKAFYLTLRIQKYVSEPLTLATIQCV